MAAVDRWWWCVVVVSRCVRAVRGGPRADKLCSRVFGCRL